MFKKKETKHETTGHKTMKTYSLSSMSFLFTVRKRWILISCEGKVEVYYMCLKRRIVA